MMFYFHRLKMLDHPLELAVEKQPLVNVDPVTRERTMSFVPVPRFPYRRIGEAV